MERLCLQNYGVSQMETREMKTVDGGLFPPIILIAIGVAAYGFGKWLYEKVESSME